MRLILSSVAIAMLALAGGCRNPPPNFNSHSMFGPPTVAPPPAGAYPASGVPGRPDAYYPGIQQPTGIAPGYTQPPPAGIQSQNQHPVGTGTGRGWQASNSTSPAATTASTATFPTNTAVNRATTPNITNGNLNEAGYGGAGVQPNNQAPSLLERIQRGRMPVHDATAPAGASVPGYAPGYPAVPGYPTSPRYPAATGYPAAPGYPTAPAQPVYQLPPSMTAIPSYSHLRGTALTSRSPSPATAGVNTASPVERSVLVSNQSPMATVRNTAIVNTESTTSDDGLKWRSKQAPALEVAKR